HRSCAAESTEASDGRIEDRRKSLRDGRERPAARAIRSGTSDQSCRKPWKERLQPVSSGRRSPPKSKRLLVQGFDIDIVSAASAAFVNATVHECIGPTLRFRRSGAAGAFVGSLENRIGQRILLALRKLEERIGNRQGAVIELKNMKTTSIPHEDGDTALAADARRSGDSHVMRAIGDRYARGFGISAMKDAVVAIGKRMGENFKAVEALDPANVVVSDDAHGGHSPATDAAAGASAASAASRRSIQAGSMQSLSTAQSSTDAGMGPPCPLDIVVDHAHLGRSVGNDTLDKPAVEFDHDIDFRWGQDAAIEPLAEAIDLFAGQRHIAAAIGGDVEKIGWAGPSSVAAQGGKDSGQFAIIDGERRQPMGFDLFDPHVETGGIGKCGVVYVSDIYASHGEPPASSRNQPQAPAAHIDWSQGLRIEIGAQHVHQIGGEDVCETLVGVKAHDLAGSREMCSGDDENVHDGVSMQ
ncbi:hypothetical protein OY671_007540, partial [Metschnikowia pulcherrima]